MEEVESKDKFSDQDDSDVEDYMEVQTEVSGAVQELETDGEK